jgi:hypothetical protein
VLQLLVAANVPSSPILVTLMMDLMHLKRQVLQEPRVQHPEGSILHSHRSENLKSYILIVNLKVKLYFSYQQ